MIEEVEWDFVTNQALRTRDSRFGERPTGNETSSHASDVKWLPVKHELPPEYLPQLSALLGGKVEFTLSKDKTHVIHTYPEADFSEEAIRYFRAGNVVEVANSVLSATDTDVMEALEKGQAPDPELTAARDKIRNRRDELLRYVYAVNVEDLLDFEPSLQEETVDLLKVSRQIAIRKGRPDTHISPDGFKRKER